MHPKTIEEAIKALETTQKEKFVLAVMDTSWKGITCFGERYNYASYFVGIRHSWTANNKVVETQILIKQEGEFTEVSAHLIGEVDFNEAIPALQEELIRKASERFSDLSRYHQYRLLLAWQEPLEQMRDNLPLVMQERLKALVKKEKKNTKESSVKLWADKFGNLFNKMIKDLRKKR